MQNFKQAAAYIRKTEKIETGKKIVKTTITHLV